MSDWLNRWLGLDGISGTVSLDRIFFLRPWTTALTVTVGVLVALFVAACYWKERRTSVVWKALLWLVRLGAFAILVLLVWQPMIRSQHTEVTPSIVALVVDESTSMNIQDRWQDVRRRQDLVQALGDPSAAGLSRIDALNRLLGQDQAATLRHLLTHHTLRLYRFGSETHVSRVTAPPKRGQHVQPGVLTVPIAPIHAADPQTRVGNALDFVLSDTAGQPLSGIVLLSDGGQNVGEDPTVPARHAGEMHVPVYTIGFGDPTLPKDVVVTTLLADEVVRKGDQVIVSVGVRQRGYDGRTVPVTLKLGDQVLQRLDVKLPAGDGQMGFNLAFTPKEVGAKTLSVSIPGQPGELTVSNNQKSLPMRIVDKKLKILYVDGSPRWEYRYLKNAIRRDETTKFGCILTESPDPARGGEGNVPVFGFPKTRKELFDYDILILGDVPREYFDPEDLKNIRAFVEERGGSLITIAGQNHMPWEYRNTDLEAILPVVIPTARRDEVFRDPFQLELTPEGARNPMMMFSTDPKENEETWKSLPGMYWCGVVDRVKPGATVLAEHPTQMGPDGKIPLMASQQVGEGTSFMSLVDSTWLWRYRNYDKYFYRFWGQVVRSLTPHELPGDNRFIRLATDRTSYALGEKVTVRSRLLTPTYHPVRAKAVNAEIRSNSGLRYPLTLESAAGAPGVFSGEWLPPRPGEYQVVVNGPEGQHGEGLTHFVVDATNLELEEPQQNETLLRRLAALSGGKYLLWSEWNSIPGRMEDRKQVVRTQVESDLWQAPLPVALFVLLLVIEWALRKRLGML